MDWLDPHEHSTTLPFRTFLKGVEVSICLFCVWPSLCLLDYVKQQCLKATPPQEVVKANSISNPDSFTSKPSNTQHLLSEESVQLCKVRQRMSSYQTYPSSCRMTQQRSFTPKSPSQRVCHPFSVPSTSVQSQVEPRPTSLSLSDFQFQSQVLKHWKIEQIHYFQLLTTFPVNLYLVPHLNVLCFLFHFDCPIMLLLS